MLVRNNHACRNARCFDMLHDIYTCISFEPKFGSKKIKQYMLSVLYQQYISDIEKKWHWPSFKTYFIYVIIYYLNLTVSVCKMSMNRIKVLGEHNFNNLSAIPLPIFKGLIAPCQHLIINSSGKHLLILS